MLKPWYYSSKPLQGWIRIRPFKSGSGSALLVDTLVCVHRWQQDYLCTQVFDKNQNGRISLAELGDVLAGIGHLKTTEVD